MIRYIDATTQRYPLFPGDIQAEHPSWNIGDPLPDGWFEVVESPMPMDPPADSVYYEELPKLVDGIYTQSWVVRALTDEEKSRISATITAKQKLVDILGLTEEEIKALAKLII